MEGLGVCVALAGVGLMLLEVFGVTLALEISTQKVTKVTFTFEFVFFFLNGQ